MLLIISTCKEKLHELEFVKPVEDILRNGNFDFFVKKYNEVSEKDLAKADKIIICGTSLKDFGYFNNLSYFSWIKNFDKPILGICAGMQIIFSVFGGRLFERGKKIKDRKEIGFISCNFKKSFFGNLDTLQVYSLHQLGLGIGRSDFEAYAFSNKGLQAAKHSEKEIYGVLFHPEVRNKNIILEFCKLSNKIAAK